MQVGFGHEREIKLQIGSAIQKTAELDYVISTFLKCPAPEFDKEIEDKRAKFLNC